MIRRTSLDAEIKRVAGVTNPQKTFGLKSYTLTDPQKARMRFKVGAEYFISEPMRRISITNTLKMVVPTIPGGNLRVG